MEDKAFDGVKWQSLLILVGAVLLMCVINITVNSFFAALFCMRSTYIKVMLLMVRNLKSYFLEKKNHFSYNDHYFLTLDITY